MDVQRIEHDRCKKTAVNLGEGFYTAEKNGIALYGDFEVRLQLNPEAVENIDYVYVGEGIYILKTLNAINRISPNRFHIYRPTKSDFLLHFLRSLKRTLIARDSGEIDLVLAHSWARGIGSVVSPDSGFWGESILFSAFEVCSKLKIEETLIHAFKNQGGLREGLRRNEKFRNHYEETIGSLNPSFKIWDLHLPKHVAQVQDLVKKANLPLGTQSFESSVLDEIVSSQPDKFYELFPDKIQFLNGPMRYENSPDGALSLRGANADLLLRLRRKILEGQDFASWEKALFLQLMKSSAYHHKLFEGFGLAHVNTLLSWGPRSDELIKAMIIATLTNFSLPGLKTTLNDNVTFRKKAMLLLNNQTSAASMLFFPWDLRRSEDVHLCKVLMTKYNGSPFVATLEKHWERHSPDAFGKAFPQRAKDLDLSVLPLFEYQSGDRETNPGWIISGPFAAIYEKINSGIPLSPEEDSRVRQ